MDRDLEKPKKSRASIGMFRGLVVAPASLPMKQIPSPIHTGGMSIDACPASDPSSGFVQRKR